MKTFPYFLIFSFFLLPLSQADESLIIIVHPAVAIDHISQRDLMNYFSKVKRFWPNGVPVRPVDWAQGQIARKYFLSQIMKKTEHELSEYWMSQKFAAGNRPPINLNSGDEICQLVATVEGSVSYLPSNTKSCPHTKTIEIKND